MSGNVKKEYSNGELTVVWKPKLCIHSEECVKRLPKVYNPDERPWIKVENATTEELMAQIDHCPSGALSYYLVGEEKKEEPTAETKVEVAKDGPLLVHGTITVKHAEDRMEVRKKVTAFCRCGASENKPYCDGTHKKIDFKG